MKKFNQSIVSVMLLLGGITLALPALASDIGSPSVEVLKGLYTGKAYSPYAKRSFPSKVY
jgi:hypothetical protein